MRVLLVTSIAAIFSVAGCRTEHNVDYPGGDLRQVQNVASAWQCAELCSDEPHCKSWTYGKKPGQWYTRTCFLKHQLKPGRRHNDCCDSGLPSHWCDGFGTCSRTQKMGCKQNCPSGWYHFKTTNHGCCKNFWSCNGTRKYCRLLLPGGAPLCGRRLEKVTGFEEVMNQMLESGHDIEEDHEILEDDEASPLA